MLGLEIKLDSDSRCASSWRLDSDGKNILAGFYCCLQVDSLLALGRFTIGRLCRANPLAVEVHLGASIAFNVDKTSLDLRKIHGATEEAVSGLLGIGCKRIGPK